MPNFDIMTKEQRKQWDEVQELINMGKEEALEHVEDFKEYITCAICETKIGYSKIMMTEAICEGCAE